MRKPSMKPAAKYIVTQTSSASPAIRRRAWLPAQNTDWQGVWCLAAMLLQAIFEIMISLLIAPFHKTSETPRVTCVESTTNMRFLQAMPSLKAFHPTWWALGPFAQTVVHGSRAVNNATPYHREGVLMHDGVAVALDWKVTDPRLSPEAPLVVVCHGLGGNSMTNSCNGVTELLARKGWRLVVYNRRGHGGSSLLAAPDWAPSEWPGSRKAFPPHIDLDDLRRVVAHVQAKYPTAPKALVGLSAGSNLVVRFQGDCAAESPFMVAVSVANGHELTHLTKTLLQKPLTDTMLVTFLKEVLYDRYDEVQHLAAEAGVHVDWDRLLSVRHTREFEALLTAPISGFKDVDDYYNANGCFQSFKDVTVPLLSLANEDDPVIDKALIRHSQDAAQLNPNIISVVTTRGGHLGWLYSTTARPWMHDVLVEFLSKAFFHATITDTTVA